MICGLTGWCMEILFTAFHARPKKDFTLKGQTSVWMFPIYGLASLIAPLQRCIGNKPAVVRGGVYTLGIFTCEYVSGSVLRKHNLCPWDYSGEPSNVNGLIRLDYAPYWMAAGLIFERILKGVE